jgi:hypothetical protein
MTMSVVVWGNIPSCLGGQGRVEWLDGGCLRPGCCVPDERTGTIGCSRLETCNSSILQRDRIGK